jgi:hypothetical protein
LSDALSLLRGVWCNCYLNRDAVDALLHFIHLATLTKGETVHALMKVALGRRGGGRFSFAGNDPRQKEVVEGEASRETAESHKGA